LVKPGEKVPADGIVVDGESYLNESMLTGESKPVKKAAHDKVIGGAVNGNGSLKVKVEHTGKDSYLNKVITMVQEAQKTKSRMQNLSDRAAKWLTIIALSAGFGTLFVWLALGKDFVFALERLSEQGLLSRDQHYMVGQKTEKSPKNFCCKHCDYTTSSKKDFNKHLMTPKHENTTKYNENGRKIPKKIYECECGKSYPYRASLYNHKKCNRTSPYNCT